jgi:hypothetical protein
MRNLKHLQLYEAFESGTLTKVFNYVNAKQRGQFKNILEQLCRQIKFPMSKLNDSLFQYLFFKKALYLAANVEDEPCEAGSPTIPGEKCSGPTGDENQGTILRIWGKGRRRVKCEVCNGTGIKPQKSKPIKWIKYWFDKDGKFVCATATDGEIRRQTVSSAVMGQYEITNANVRPSDLLSYKTGDQFLFTASKDPYEEVVATLWIWGSRAYMIQDEYEGSSSDIYSNPESKEWRQYGSCSWVVASSGDLSGALKSIVKKPSSDVPADPYSWNALLNTNAMKIGGQANMKDRLANAHFALVLDYSKLMELSSSGQIMDTTKIKQQRETSREGALALKLPAEIKDENYARYIDKISSNIQITDDLSNLKRMFSRILGMDKAGYYVLQGLRFDNMSSFMSRLVDFMDADDQHKDYYLDKVSTYMKDIMRGNKEYNTNMTQNIDYLIGQSPSQKHTQIVQKLIEVNKVICEKISQSKVETLEELVVFYNKVRSIRYEYRDNPVFRKAKNASDVNYYLESNDNDRCLRYLSRIDQSEIDGILKNFDLFIKFIKTL